MLLYCSKYSGKLSFEVCRRRKKSKNRGRIVRKVIAMVCLKWAALSRFAKEMIHAGSHEWKEVARNKWWLIWVKITASVKLRERSKLSLKGKKKRKLKRIPACRDTVTSWANTASGELEPFVHNSGCRARKKQGYMFQSFVTKICNVFV